MAKILIVDDEIVNSKLYGAKLSAEGYEVVLCQDGEQALEKIKEKYDLTILDIMMPRVSGTEILKEIRGGVNKTSKVIVFTNLVNEQTKKECLENGADEVLFKVDVTPLQLLEKVRSYFK